MLFQTFYTQVIDFSEKLVTLKKKKKLIKNRGFKTMAVWEIEGIKMRPKRKLFR